MVSAEFPSVGFELGGIENLPSLSLTADEWESPRFPFYEFDSRVEDLPCLDLAAEPVAYDAEDSGDRIERRRQGWDRIQMRPVESR